MPFNLLGKKIARPTDQRLKVGVLFQGYVKKTPNLKAYINLVYQTGLLGGSPTGADPFEFQQRLRDYKRADIGVFYELVIPDKKTKHFAFFITLNLLKLDLRSLIFLILEMLLPILL